MEREPGTPIPTPPPPGTADETEAPVAATPDRLLTPLAIIGIVALVGAQSCALALWLQAPAERGAVLPGLTAGLGLLGAWLLAWGRPARWVLPIAILLCSLGAAAFSLTWIVAGWSLSGVGLGALGAWSYHRRHRALVATLTLLAAGYAVAASAGLLASMRGHSHWWVAGQGLASMLLGGLLLRLGTADEDEERRHPAVAGARRRARLRIAGRLLIVVGILLPYAALVMLELAEILVG